MLIFAIGLIALGALLPTLPPSAFNQTGIHRESNVLIPSPSIQLERSRLPFRSEELLSIILYNNTEWCYNWAKIVI